ncbi:MAG TPA: cytochrome c [Pirellulales bacterium]|jgi:mono/diheme cytochrome c family protein
MTRYPNNSNRIALVCQRALVCRLTLRCRWTLLCFWALVLPLVAGCQQKMADQPGYRPLEASKFFADGRSARPAISGTVARGHLQTDRALFTGRLSGERKPVAKPAQPNPQTEPEAMQLAAVEAQENEDFIDYFPLAVNQELVEHGRDRYMIYCVVCHDARGTGHGKIVERGYTRPPSYHVERLRKAPVGRLFAVMTDGYGSMPSYAEQIPVRDRWAIASYVRALQLSQHFPADELPAELRDEWTRKEHSATEGRSP